MSKGIDYSKWDNIEDSDEEDEKPKQPAARPPAAAATAAEEGGGQKLTEAQKKELIENHPEVAAKAGLMPQTQKNKKDSKRKQYLHQGQMIYEWEQGLDEINIYIQPPPGITAQMFDIEIKADHLMVGIKGNPERYLNHTTWGRVKCSESFWTLEDSELHLTMTKLDKGTPWDAALQGHEPLDPLAKQEIRGDIMRERFAEEHPGFDFSNATFNGNVPDPSK
eukprot:CAMPEP_0173393680 /NCGR_PEP_ID=MMETSP1356-20130122/22250_1 /TAXON_ID=77927 ORGANISM="Hemiselmis virescens, Strain PCC157" /NCGR_SAMPLE_ID=MMETSP1356 /ASSEMBLY_ACC=CAM_ASM_000847 /LENGTH=221 /DNA_ID=CAMNT_0014351737 /DNA_START=63 /DNA_END=725 /DNA_ORIENTATION=+